MGLGSADKTGLGALQNMSRDRVRLRAVAIRRMMRRMRDDIKENAGPIVLGVTFLAGLAWLLLGCGGATDRSGPMSEPARTTEPAPVDSGAAVADAATDTLAPCGYALAADIYCPNDSGVTTAYWCHSDPGTFTSPRPGCWPLVNTWSDSGSIGTGQWCCR